MLQDYTVQAEKVSLIIYLFVSSVSFLCIDKIYSYCTLEKHPLWASVTNYKLQKAIFFSVNIHCINMFLPTTLPFQSKTSYSVNVSVVCLCLVFCSLSWATWLCSCALHMPTFMAGTNFFVPPPSNGTPLRDSCCVWLCRLWCWCSRCCSFFHAWTAPWLGFVRAGREPSRGRRWVRAKLPTCELLRLKLPDYWLLITDGFIRCDFYENIGQTVVTLDEDNLFIKKKNCKNLYNIFLHNFA